MKIFFPVLVYPEILTIFTPNFSVRVFLPLPLLIFIMTIDGELNVHSTTPNASGTLHVTSFLAISSLQTWYSASVQPIVRFEFSCGVSKLQSPQKLKAKNKLNILFSSEYSSKLLHLTDCAGSLTSTEHLRNNRADNLAKGRWSRALFEIPSGDVSTYGGEEHPTQNPFLESLGLANSRNRNQAGGVGRGTGWY